MFFVASNTFYTAKEQHMLISTRAYPSNLHKILYLLASEPNFLIESNLREKPGI